MTGKGYEGGQKLLSSGSRLRAGEKYCVERGSGHFLSRENRDEREDYEHHPSIPGQKSLWHRGKKK